MQIDEGTLYKHIGGRLRVRRQELALTQKQLAERLGLERTSIANIESGLQKPPLHLLYRYCQTLGLEVAAVLPPLRDVTLRPAPEEEIRIDGQPRPLPPKTATLVRDLLKSLAEDT